MHSPIDYLKVCFNAKVIALLVVIGAAILILAPQLAVAAIPVLILAACPLSMLLMGAAMMRHHEAAEANPSTTEAPNEVARLREHETLTGRTEDGQHQRRD
jgi:hypothetical protein